MSYIVYILKCSDNTLYTGITTDLERRLRQHNGEIVGGAKYTKYRGPFEIIYVEKYDDRSNATKREIEIKKLKREEKITLINSYKK